MRILLLSCAVFASFALQAQAGRRRALLIGINDYTASRTGTKHDSPAAPQRDWPNLSGAVNDVRTLEQMLPLVYGFAPSDVVALTDHNATRAAILSAIEQHLVVPAAKGDIVFFYYAGHGSQVVNTLSDEPDKLDESIVPADSRAGARDIRDKELRSFFNRILDRGARLTIVLDNCHSGSGARGLLGGARSRGIAQDRRDIAKRTTGARPENRGALVIAAAQDSDIAWETRDAEGKMHGAFSWAWIRAMRDAAPGEPAIETFLRAQARLRNETPYQEPVIAGTAEARLAPFLGTRIDRRGERAIVAVEKVRNDGTVVLQGGWANGLAIGSELRIARARDNPPRLRVTNMTGLGRCEARVEAGHPLPQGIRSGALLEVDGWAAPDGRALRVWAPTVDGSMAGIRLLARRIGTAAAKRGVRLLSDPTDKTPDYLLRHGQLGWELHGPRGAFQQPGDNSAAIASTARIPAGATLFVQLPAPATLVEGMNIEIDREGIERVTRPDEADYILAGRLSPAHRLEYAWVRPSVRNGDRGRTGLPVRTAWISEDERESVSTLRSAAVRLRRIQAWQLLESPPRARFPYRLEVERSSDQRAVRDGVVLGDEIYDLVLRPRSNALPPRVAPRYVYIFAIDSNGKSVLLYPEQNAGSVENRLPAASPPPAEITLASFQVEPPYGLDTFMLLTTDEQLPNPWIVEGQGVRSGRKPTALEELLLRTSTAARGRSIVTPANWSIEKYSFQAVAPRRTQ